MIFEQPDVPGESEPELNSLSLNRTVEDKATFRSETEFHPLNTPDSSIKLFAQSTVSSNKEIYLKWRRYKAQSLLGRRKSLII